MAETAKMERTRTPGIYRRGDRYAITWRDATGKQRWASARTYDGARALKADKERQARAGEEHVPLSALPTLGEYAAEVFGAGEGDAFTPGRYQGRSHGAVRPATIRHYARDMRAWWEPLLGSKRLPAIKAPDINRALAQLASRDGDEYLADRTLRRLFAPLSVLLGSAVEEGLIPYNPARDLRVPSGRDAQRRVSAGDHDDEHDDVKPYTRAQIRALLAVLEPRLELRALILLLATTGLRISEAVALQWKHVQLDGSDPHVKVRRAWVYERFAEPKSRHSRRKVPINRQLVDALREHRTHGDPRVELVFASSVGTVLRPENLRRTLLPFAQEANVPWHGFHGFRHAFASMLIEDGRNVVQISRLLGHHSPAFTLSVYAHLMDDGTGGPVELDLTPVPEALGAGVDYVLSQEAA